MATFRKRRERWQVQIRRAGSSPQSRSFVSRQDAEKWARTIERQIDLGQDPSAGSDKRLVHITLGALVDRYIDEIVCHKRSGEYETIILRAFQRHPICKRSLRQIRLSDFAAYRAERLTAITPASLRRQLNPIQNMLEIVQKDWGLPILENPLKRFRLAGQSPRRERRLRAGELERICSVAAKSRNHLILPIILFALETALRRSEILAARWSDLQLENRLLVIPKAKNGHTRAIPLTRGAVRILMKLQSQSSGQANEDYIFPISTNALKMAWRRLLRRAGIADMHFHDLRHEAISRFFELGLTAPEVASISGHRDLRMLFRYSHSDRQRVIRQLDQVSYSGLGSTE